MIVDENGNVIDDSAENGYDNAMDNITQEQLYSMYQDEFGGYDEYYDDIQQQQAQKKVEQEKAKQQKAEVGSKDIQNPNQEMKQEKKEPQKDEQEKEVAPTPPTQDKAAKQEIDIDSLVNEELQKAQNQDEKNQIAKEGQEAFNKEFGELGKVLDNTNNDILQDKASDIYRQELLDEQNTKNPNSNQAKSIEEQDNQRLQDTKTFNTLLMLKEEIEKRDSVEERELISITALKDFKSNYAEINDCLNLAEQDGAGNTKENEAQNENANELENDEKEEEVDLSREQDSLDRAIDNIIKSHSIADFIRALYTLDKALYQIDEAKNHPKENPVMKEMIAKAENGEPLTKETAIKAMAAMKESRDKVDKIVLQRNKELNNKAALTKDMDRYKSSIDKGQKEKYAKNLSDRIEHINKELPSFKDNEAETFDKATKLVEKHKAEREQVQQNTRGFMGKSRER